MNTDLQKYENQLPITIPQCVEIAYRSMKGELITCDDIAAAYDIPLVDAMKLITNPIFSHLVHNIAIANAKLGFDAIAFRELINIARHDIEPKNKINAIRTLADLTNNNESKKAKASKTEININLDAIVRQQTESPFKGF